jgi:signal transduction histidine kinase
MTNAKSVPSRLILRCADAEVLRMCREFSGWLQQRGIVLVEDAPEGVNWQHDVCLRDFDPEDQACKTPSGCRDLFLVERRDLEALKRSHPGGLDPNVLLKPVTRATLWAFLDSAFTVPEDRAASQMQTLREDRDDILQSLIETNLRLQRYDQERTAFLARAVHEFRAPLTALTGYFGLILDNKLGPLTASQADALKHMRLSAERLSRMVGEMLMVSAGRSVHHPATLRKGNLARCVDQALREILPACQRKQIRVTVNLEPQQGPLYFDESQIEQVLLNLLDNSAKFTPKEGFIEITGRPDFWDRRVIRPAAASARENRRIIESSRPNSYRISIHDSGPGIQPGMVDEIFEEYTSQENGDERCGTGLGLAICKLFINRHNGRIWAESDLRGASFSFVMPTGTQPELWSSDPVMTFAQQAVH